MTREQAANEYAIKNRDIVRSSDYEIAETAFLAGCEHADKEHMERIQQQAQEIERLKEIKVFLENEVDRLHGGNDKLKQRIAELEAQLKESEYRYNNAVERNVDKRGRIAELEGALKTLKHRIATFDDDPDHLLEVIRVALESEKPEAQKEDLDKMFKQWTEPEAQQQERILCAAICNPEEKDMAGNTLIFAGLRHVNVLWQSESISRNPRHQGFLTSRGRFVDRKEALKIALENNQVRDVSQIRGDNLYSEDLY